MDFFIHVWSCTTIMFVSVMCYCKIIKWLIKCLMFLQKYRFWSHSTFAPWYSIYIYFVLHWCLHCLYTVCTVYYNSQSKCTLQTVATFCYIYCTSKKNLKNHELFIPRWPLWKTCARWGHGAGEAESIV